MTDLHSTKPIVFDEIAIIETDIEKQLADIYRDVLGVNNMAVDERFLDIGGNSLNLVEVVEQVKEKLGVTLEPRLFFDRNKSTIAELSKEIKALQSH